MLSKDSKKGENHQENDNNKQPTYWERVIRGKGTVAEDWPTAEELWNNKEVQDEIKEVKNTFNQIKEKSNS